MLFTVLILGASSYETRRANDTASILVVRLKSEELKDIRILIGGLATELWLFCAKG